MPLYKAECSQCNDSFKARTRTNLLNKIRKHIWKKHRNWMISRIKKGKASTLENPSIQDFITALKDAPSRAVSIYVDMTERQYQHMKTVLDAIEILLPLEVQASWKMVEAIHDELKH